MITPVFQSNSNNNIKITQVKKYAKELLPEKDLPENNYKSRYLRDSFIGGSFIGLFSYFAMEYFKCKGSGLKALGIGVGATLVQYIGMLTGRLIESTINKNKEK